MISKALRDGVVVVNVCPMDLGKAGGGVLADGVECEVGE